MPKYLILFILLFTLSTALFALSTELPAALTASGNPELFNSISAKAKANLKNMPASLSKPYKTMLRKHPDILMAFLIAYESNAVLAEANPRDVQSNYNQTVQLLQLDGMNYSPELFLSYIAKQTVSDERITPYRELLFAEGLQQIMISNPVILDRYRAVSLWSVENLVFQQTSGRDQSPYDITQKSIVGRCEEMQILFVAACRVAGIPARPASTPYWAHMDNNHAWAEVFMDGKWIYTGDMDAAYFPNQTWFSAMVDKTILILTEGSIPADGEEILYQDDSGAVINSTRNYLGERTRTLNLKIRDEKGNPVPETTVSIMVYNWSSLRPILRAQTDQNGELSLSVGKGAFYVLAYKDSLRTLIPISSESTSIINREATLGTEDMKSTMLMEYPGNAFDWQQAPETWNEGVRLAKSKWQSKVKSYTDRALPLAISPSDSLLAELWIACKHNQDAFADFLELHQSGPAIASDFASYLLSADPKFLWQARADQFEALYRFYLEQHDFIQTLNDQALEALLSPTVHYEELPEPFYYKGKPNLYPRYFISPAASPEQRLEQTIAMLLKRYKLDGKRAMSGLLRLDLAAASKYLYLYQLKILACSALRANGIPADFSRAADLINVYIDGQWKYYSITNNKYADQSSTTAIDANLTAIIQIVDSDGIPVDIHQVQLSFYRDGSFYPVNQQPAFVGNGRFEGEYPAGEYLVQVGYRISDSKTFYSIAPLTLSENTATNTCRIRIEGYEQNWDNVPEELMPIAAELQKQGLKIAILGRYQQENTMRLYIKLEATGKSFVLVDAQAAETISPEHTNYFIVSPEWAKIIARDPDKQYRNYTLYLSEDGTWKIYEGLWESLPK
jgi:hypothetical protein